MAKKTISNTFTVNTVEDGESAPYYFEEWFAWSNDATTASVTTEPTINGTWATSIPAQGSYAYLWRKFIRNVYDNSTRQYIKEQAQYFRMSGTNGTSITPKGNALAYTDQSASAVVPNPANGDIVLYVGRSHESDNLDRYEIYDWTTMAGSWEGYAAADGDSYVLPNGHMMMYSSEAHDWLDLGQFQGQNGKTYYTHVAWATNVNYNSSGAVTSVEGFTTVKSPNDTTHLWMGVLVNEISGTDPADATLYTWSYTKGVDGKNGTIYDITLEEAWCRVDNTGTITAALKGYAYKVSGETRMLLPSATIRYGYKPDDSDTYTATQTDNSGKFDVGTWFNGDEVGGYAKNSNQIFAAIVVDGSIVCIKYVTMAYDGQQGQRGKIGRFFYFAGTFNSSNTSNSFLVNDAQAPYFEHTVDGQKRYHVFNYEINGSYTMSQMWSISSGSWNNSPWEAMTNDFKYLITEAMFAEYAKLGSAIFSGDWMISQQGAIDGQTISSVTAYMVGSTTSPYTTIVKPYTLFNPDNPLGGVTKLTVSTYNTTISSSETTHNIIMATGRQQGILYKITSKVKDGTTFSGTPLKVQIDKNNTYDPITLFIITAEETEYTAYYMVPANTIYRFRLVRDSTASQNDSITTVMEQVSFETRYAVDLFTGKTYLSDAYVKGSIIHPSLAIDTTNYTTYRQNEQSRSYLQLSDVTATNIYVYYFPSISYSSALGYYYAFVALPEITDEMIGKEITICNAATDALSRTDLAIELRIISHGTISGTGLSVDLNNPNGLLVTRLCGSTQWSGAVPPYRTESNALILPLQHEVRFRAVNKYTWAAIGTPYSIIGE